jgi:co-chaperonin GroES (HSP10)
MSNVGAKAVQQRLGMTVDPATIRPLGVMVLLEKLPANRTEAGLVLPESANMKGRAKVHAVGEGTLDGGVRTPIGVKPGDRVVLSPGWQGVELGKLANGNALFLAQESVLLAVDTADYDATLRIEALQ